MDFPQPKDVQGIRSFLAMANHYAKFSDKLAETSAALRGLIKASVPWVWTKAQEDSFNGVKGLFKETPVLAVYSPESETIITSDASNAGLGATLTQI